MLFNLFKTFVYINTENLIYFTRAQSFLSLPLYPSTMAYPVDDADLIRGQGNFDYCLLQDK